MNSSSHSFAAADRSTLRLLPPPLEAVLHQEGPSARRRALVGVLLGVGMGALAAALIPRDGPNVAARLSRAG